MTIASAIFMSFMGASRSVLQSSVATASAVVSQSSVFPGFLQSSASASAVVSQSSVFSGLPELARFCSLL
jgi:hypothetical protein